MQPELQQGFDLIELQRTDLQSRVLIMNDAQLNWAAEAGSWSILQVIEHLVLGDETVGQARDAGTLGHEPLPFRLLPRSLRRALVLHALRRDMVLPLPSPDLEPLGKVPLAALLSRWDASRREMRRVLETMRGNEKRYAHPVLGPLTPVQMLELGVTHTAYHTRQIEAMQRAAAFPIGVSSSSLEHNAQT